MMKARRLVTTVFLSLLFAPSVVFSFEGPLQVRNQFPLFLLVDAPYLERASPEDSLSLSLSYSSVFTVRSSADWSVHMDMELAEFMIRFKKNFGNSLEIGLDIPLLSYNSGFMDGFLNWYHDTFGFPDYGRSTRPANEFLYEVSRKGKLAVKGDNGGIGLGDIRVSAKKTVLTADPLISVRADLEFPTGDAQRGYGSGSVDAGIALLIEKRITEKINAYAAAGAVFPGDLKGHEKIELRSFLYGGAAVEAALCKNLFLLGQVFLQGSPFPKTDISAVDRTAVLLSLGMRYVWGRNSLEISFTEDPNTAGAPDVSVNLTLKRRF